MQDPPLVMDSDEEEHTCAPEDPKVATTQSPPGKH